MSEILSYSKVLSDIHRFKQVQRSDNEFNTYDVPSHKYFKLLFYFGSTHGETSEDTVRGSGLLDPSWEIWQKDNKLPFYDFNSAWGYLMLNGETERASYLQQFVTLLSDINSNSPWYFSKIGGLSEALERKVAEDGKLEISNKKLTITCMPDAFDNRISTLLELYRSAAWSWIHKKEIIPANLRKFDMAVYIFETPTTPQHLDTDKFYVASNEHITPEVVSYKMIEFHDCEFNYNSIKSGWSDIDNAEGTTPTYTIDITYSDCYEISYNDKLVKLIGDCILVDDDPNSIFIDTNDKYYRDITHQNTEYKAPVKKDEEKEETYKDYLNKIRNINEYITFGNLSERTGNRPENFEEIKQQTRTVYQPGFIGNAVGQVVGHVVSDFKDLVNKALLGNIYTYSLTQIASQVSDLSKGNLIKAGMTAVQYGKEIKERADNRKNKKGKNDIKEDNLYSDEPVPQPSEPLEPRVNTIFSNSVKAKTIAVKSLGNIYKGSVANNL